MTLRKGEVEVNSTQDTWYKEHCSLEDLHTHSVTAVSCEHNYKFH